MTVVSPWPRLSHSMEQVFDRGFEISSSPSLLSTSPNIGLTACSSFHRYLSSITHTELNPPLSGSNEIDNFVDETLCNDFSEGFILEDDNFTDSSNAIKPRFGILKLSHSNSDNNGHSKRVYFADSVGQRLVTSKEFNHNEEIMLSFKSIEREFSITEQQFNFEFGFPQPSQDFAAFVEKLNQTNVSLDSIFFKNPNTVSGTIKVKNIGFEKRVFIRCSFDSWRTSRDFPAYFLTMNSSGHSSYDTFRFEFEIPNGVRQSIEFCICFSVNDAEFWDNNFGNNFIINCLLPVLSPHQRQAIASPSGESKDPTLFSYWRENISIDQERPYW